MLFSTHTVIDHVDPLDSVHTCINERDSRHGVELVPVFDNDVFIPKANSIIVGEDSVYSLHTDTSISGGIPFSFDGTQPFRQLNQRQTPLCLFNITKAALPCVCTLLDSTTIRMSYNTGLTVITYIQKSISEYTPVHVRSISSKQFIIQSDPGCANPKAVLNIAGYCISNSPPKVKDHIDNAMHKLQMFVHHNNIRVIYYEADKSDEETDFTLPLLKSRLTVPSEIMEYVMKQLWFISDLPLTSTHPMNTCARLIDSNTILKPTSITLKMGDKIFELDPALGSDPWIKVDNFFFIVREYINANDIGLIEFYPCAFNSMGQCTIGLGLNWAIDLYIYKKIMSLAYKEKKIRTHTTHTVQVKHRKGILWPKSQKPNTGSAFGVIGTQLK